MAGLKRFRSPSSAHVQTPSIVGNYQTGRQKCGANSEDIRDLKLTGLDVVLSHAEPSLSCK